MAQVWAGLALYLDWEVYADGWDREHDTGRYVRGGGARRPRCDRGRSLEAAGHARVTGRHDSFTVQTFSKEVAEALKMTSIVSLLEYVIREVQGTEGEVQLEAVFSNGTFRRGYVRSGPLTGAQLETSRAASSWSG